MKKLFTLLALLTCFLGANAFEVVDVDIDFTTQETLWGWGAGWNAAENSDYFSLDGDGLHWHSEEATENNFDVQLQPFPGCKGDVDFASYTITITLKGAATGDSPENRIWLAFGGSETPGWVEVPAAFQEFTFTDVVNNHTAQYFADSNTLLLQCGHFVGDFWIKSIKITHDEKEQAPVDWVNIITNGDASAAWANPDAQVVANAYEGEGAEEICAYSKEYGYNDNNPHAAFIEDGVFYTTTVPCPEVADPDCQWQNQFWINFPRKLKADEHFKLTFDYKASENAQGTGQGHRAPGDYLGGWGPGNLDFTQEWQTFSQEFDASADCQSIAFNLGVNGQHEREITFYFDNIKLEYMDLQEGWFVAATDTEDGDPAYDYDNAIEFADDADGMISAIVGGESEDTWVNQIMISTQKGNDKGFRAATIKVDTSEGPIKNDPVDYHGYEAKGKTAIDLPVLGMWKIYIDTESQLISFEKLAGKEDLVLLEVIPNPTEITVEGLAKVEADWDNQLWIAANRNLEAGEEILFEFDYYMTSDEVEEASTDIQAHNVGADGAPCNYLDWNTGLPGPTFTTEEQHYKQVWTVPASCGGMRSFCFNMAKVEADVNYTVKNVVIMKSDLTERLLDPEDEGTFAWRKIGRGGYYQYPEEPQPKPDAVKGDVNGDNVVDALDLQDIISQIVIGEFDAAKDVNGDGVVDALDIQDTISIIVGQ